MKAIIDRYQESNIDVHLTFFRHRKPSQDAFFEVANPSHAKMAPNILRGLWSIGVHPWKPEYQAAFVSPQDADSAIDTCVKHQMIRTNATTGSSHRSNKNRDYLPRHTRDEEVSNTPVAKQSSLRTENRSITPDMMEHRTTTSQSGKRVQQDQTVVELKETILKLREELVQAKTDAITSKEKASDLNWKNKELTQDHTYNLQKMETLGKDCDDLKKRLDEAQDDIKYYKDKWEGEQSRTKDHRRMEEKVDRLLSSKSRFETRTGTVKETHPGTGAPIGRGNR